MKYFIANWKANKNLNEAIQWMDVFLTLLVYNDRAKVVICPPSPLILPLKEKIKNSKNIYLGAQDLSPFEFGAFTGEVTAKTLQGIVDYVIIGHSERRTNFGETDKDITKKINLANKYKITPLFCIQDEKTKIDPRAKFIVYEPPWAISDGFDDSMNTKMEQTPEAVINMRKTLAIDKNKLFLYGGSVNSHNINQYSQHSQIDGVLVGGASLDPQVFYQIIIKSFLKN